jgi:hypothetical protein
MVRGNNGAGIVAAAREDEAGPIEVSPSFKNLYRQALVVEFAREARSRVMSIMPRTEDGRVYPSTLLKIPGEHIYMQSDIPAKKLQSDSEIDRSLLEEKDAEESFDHY